MRYYEVDSGQMLQNYAVNQSVARGTRKAHREISDALCCATAATAHVH